MPPWFRFYSETLTDRKIDRICRSTDTIKATVIGSWAILMALASDSPVRGALLLTEDIPFTYEDLADELGMDANSADSLLEQFARFSMIHSDNGVIYLSNWDKRQFASDDSTERVKRYRDNRKDRGLTSGPSYNAAAIIKDYDQTCVYCGSTVNPCVDHVLPISQGGDDNGLNLVCACKQCNSGKAGRTPEQAGYTFQSAVAEARYREYLLLVTVTVTSGNSDSSAPETEQSRTDSETETETDSEAETEADSAYALSTPADNHRHGLVMTRLQEIGIGDPKRTQLAACHWVTVPYIDQWWAYVRSWKQCPDNVKISSLIRRMEERRKPPADAQIWKAQQ